MHSRKNAILKYSLISLLFINATLMITNKAEEYIQELTVDNVSKEFNKQLNCLTENIYYEAGSESYEGKLAVAQVTLNRVNSGKFPTSICNVVGQKNVINGSLVCQFSWTCKKELQHPNRYLWEECLYVARKALTNPYAHDILYKQNALYYHANYVSPGWHLMRIGQIGNHIFYKEKT